MLPEGDTAFEDVTLPNNEPVAEDVLTPDRELADSVLVKFERTGDKEVIADGTEVGNIDMEGLAEDGNTKDEELYLKGLVL